MQLTLIESRIKQNHKTINISCGNNENHENQIIQIDNNEIFEILRTSLRIMKIIKI